MSKAEKFHIDRGVGYSSPHKQGGHNVSGDTGIGEFWHPMGIMATKPASQVLGISQANPAEGVIYVGGWLRASEIGFTVTGAGAADTTATLSLYRDSDQLLGITRTEFNRRHSCDIYPGSALIYEKTDFAVDSTGDKTDTVDLFLPPGLYWARLIFNAGSGNFSIKCLVATHHSNKPRSSLYEESEVPLVWLKVGSLMDASWDALYNSPAHLSMSKKSSPGACIQDDTATPPTAAIVIADQDLFAVPLGPFVVPWTISEVGILLNPGAGNLSTTWGLYSDAGGYPGTLVTNFGLQTTNTTGWHTKAAAYTFAPGRYWLAALMRLASGLSDLGIMQASGYNGFSDAGTDWPQATLYAANVGAGLPTTFPSGAAGREYHACISVRHNSYHRGVMAQNYPYLMTPAPRAKSGWFIGTMGTRADTGTEEKYTTGDGSCYPVYIERPFNCTGLGFRVAAGGANSHCEAGIYQDTGNFQPGALLASGTIATDGAVGTRSVAWGSIRLEPGIYWLALRQVDGTSPEVEMGVPSNAAAYCVDTGGPDLGHRIVGLGNLPDPWTGSVGLTYCFALGMNGSWPTFN